LQNQILPLSQNDKPMQKQFIPPKITFLLVNQKQKIRIPVQNIIMLEGFANYTLIHLQNGNKKLYARTLGHFEALLSEDNFIRVHRGFLINPCCISHFDTNENILYLDNNIEVSVSRRKKRKIRSIF
jgi:two-component system, LytTR family, response regulator